MSAATPTARGADLRHVDTWLFDLDNTLYPLESGLAPRISERITDFVERLTGLARDEARALQKRYLAEHGLTLRGLMTHHGVDPDDYHAYLNEVDLAGLAVDPSLAPALQRLPGRRIIFTNADEGHARRVLEQLRLAHLFDAVFHIADAAFEPKPSVLAFERVMAAHDIAPGATAFFEDIERNLEPAASLGMTTVLVGEHALASSAPFVNFRTADLASFLADATLREEPRA
ncbi:MAG TPA: pyrimidine 5'-nucleotidase [Caulobacteraceae bacterium]|jgi:putative hydrolase of the HAD superfamily|nr:pyrimidine 5'-nucleotidase [Caulobacteraceae bacterium]